MAESLKSRPLRQILFERNAYGFGIKSATTANRGKGGEFLQLTTIHMPSSLVPWPRLSRFSNVEQRLVIIPPARSIRIRYEDIRKESRTFPWPYILVVASSEEVNWVKMEVLANMPILCNC